MHTLPVTCNQVGLILIIIITITGVLLTVFGGDYRIGSISFIGVIMLGVEGVLLFIAGIVFGVEWLEKNVRCKCNRNE